MVECAAAESEVLTRSELAGLLQVSEWTVLDMQQAGMPHLRFGHHTVRYVWEECVAWAASNAAKVQVKGDDAESAAAEA